MSIKPFLPSTTKLGQGNVFTGICDSVNRGGSASVHAGMPPPPPGADPPEQTHPPPGADTPSREEQTPPDTEHAGRYGQRAGGTHPTGMQSCTYVLSTLTDNITNKYNDSTGNSDMAVYRTG